MIHKKQFAPAKGKLSGYNARAQKDFGSAVNLPPSIKRMAAQNAAKA